MRFDRVLTNPPFSIRTTPTAPGIPQVPRAVPLRLVPRGSKKADLMFVQHMVAVLRDGGMVAAP
jgi:type I restriction enzyme M protein